jgi:hypothetical protein
MGEGITMSGVVKKSKNKQTITVEEIENGAVRITVAGPPYMVTTGAERTSNLSTHDISEVWLSDFAPDKGEDRATYSAEYCTDTGSLHSRSTECDGLCHDLNCSEPADFFQHWKSSNGEERCIPLCKWHSRDLTHYVGRAVLWALNYGVVEDLRFWTQEDPLPVGPPRCDFHYYAVDSWGDSERARCTEEATTKVRVTELWPEGKVYDAKLCDACAECELKRPDAVENEFGYHRHKVEII